jgi:hypothetical protein
MRAGSLAQGVFDVRHLRWRQSRLATGAPGRPQRRPPAAPPRAIPAHDALATDAQPPGDGALPLSARRKPPRGLLPTYFQSEEIPSWCNMGGHAFHRTTGRRSDVTILCEIQ